MFQCQMNFSAFSFKLYCSCVKSTSNTLSRSLMTIFVLSYYHIHFKTHICMKLTSHDSWKRKTFFTSSFFAHLRKLLALRMKLFFFLSFLSLFKRWELCTMSSLEYPFAFDRVHVTSVYFLAQKIELFFIFYFLRQAKWNSLFSSTMNIKFLFHIRLGKVRNDSDMKAPALKFSFSRQNELRRELFPHGFLAAWHFSHAIRHAMLKE